MFLRPKILLSNKVFNGPWSQRLLEWEVRADSTTASLVFLGTYAKKCLSKTFLNFKKIIVSTWLSM